MSSHPLRARDAVQRLRASPIREVANVGMGKHGVLAFWFGEPDEVTPQFIRDAATAALNAGETFYTQNLGIPPLRQAIADYLSGRHKQPIPSERVVITSSGVTALMLVTQALVGPGDHVVAVTPLWPNLVEMPKIMGATVTCMPLSFAPSGWTLDLDRLIESLKPGTRALYVNSPNNPTGWTIRREEQRALLEHCMRHGIWIIADDAYERLYYPDPHGAPSFLDIAPREARIVSVNTFSKSWLMTGWRMGWAVAPPELVPALGVLIEYNTSCAPGFVQRAGVVAVRDGEPVVAHTLKRYIAARDFLVGHLRELRGIEVALPPGAMYAFFKVDGMRDSLAFCKRLVTDAGLGLAPGIAFGPEGEGFVRWCFASTEARLADGVERLARSLG